MAAKIGKSLPAGHTAGIFADMTLDGPEIGTLVAVIDRAKNLPNRRTMGKQDPYCAMRLGKEAKKTGTDKRGGQTPKWDQELRFTVHDSLDYYKLKCSVFNDDKKTDLIGEAWIDLRGVVVPGGGQNDLWHQLQFKGKYAGDVRMELTYYDTRSKEEPPMEKRRDKEKPEGGRVNSTTPDGAGGRKLGPREVKRRPLPTGPSSSTPVSRPSPPDHVHSAPIPHLYRNESPNNLQPEYNDQWAPDAHYHVLENTEGSTMYHEPLSCDRSEDTIPPMYNNQQVPGAIRSSVPYQTPSSYEDFDRPGGLPDSDGFSFGSAQSSFPVTPANASQRASFQGEARHAAQLSDPIAYRSSPFPVIPQYRSSPPTFTPEASPAGSSDYQQQQHPSFRRYSTSPIKSDVFRDSPLRHSISQYDAELTLPEQQEISEVEGPPPPPPAHRSNLQLSTLSSDEHEDILPVKVPQPLKLGSGNHRMSLFDRSPLQSIERNYDPDYQSSLQSLPSPADREPSYTAYSKPTYSSPTLPARGNSYDRPSTGIENTPPSLRSGYKATMEEVGEAGEAGETGDCWMQTERDVRKQTIDYAESPHQRDTQMLPSRGSPYQLPNVEDEEQVLTTEPPFVKHQSASPDPRAFTMRKAISPQPFAGQGEQRLSGVPFGPDSYEIFHPSSPLSSSVAGSESRYETPEQAKEAARQSEVQKLRDQGPIIGNDGRVIDPSDHLPTDTWAPEPERKTRKPEMIIRYKTKDATPRTPNRYGSSPGTARPHSVTGPMYGSSPSGTGLPVTFAQQDHGRNRLQKQMSGRPLPMQPFQHAHSSPAVPTANHNLPSPRASYHTRPDLTDYSVYGEHGQRHSRGGSLGGSHGGVPPIPAKVPISPATPSDRYSMTSGMDALSAELSTIDIGASSGARGSRMRHLYGS